VAGRQLDRGSQNSPERGRQVAQASKPASAVLCCLAVLLFQCAGVARWREEVGWGGWDEASCNDGGEGFVMGEILELVSAREEKGCALWLGLRALKYFGGVFSLPSFMAFLCPLAMVTRGGADLRGWRWLALQDGERGSCTLI
jgi:hypothetical protein